MTLKRFLFIIFAAIVALTFLITRLYNFENRFSFDNDQEQAANAAWQLIVNKKPTLIGLETSVGGLFVGPLIYWLNSITMFLGNLDPVSIGYQGIFVSFFTLVLFFVVTNEIASCYQALLAAFLYAISARLAHYDLSGSPQTYIMLPSLLIFWMVIKVFVQKKTQLFPFLAFFLALSFQIHYVLSLFLIPVLLLVLLSKPKLTKKIVFLSLVSFVLPLSTFILFDLRHDFLIAKKLITFLTTTGGQFSSSLTTTVNTYISLVTESIFTKNDFSIILFAGLLSIFVFIFARRTPRTISPRMNARERIHTSEYLGVSARSCKLEMVIPRPFGPRKFIMKKSRQGLLLTSLLMAFSPLIILFFYKGPIPEYYFLPQVPLFLIMTSFVIFYIFEKSQLIFLLILLIIAFYNVIQFKDFRQISTPLSLKKKVVESVIKKAKGEIFNVYYQMPPGINNGYRYLFKWKRQEPQEGASRLFILEFVDYNKFDPSKYYLSFPAKEIEIERPGSFVHIVSVK